MFREFPRMKYTIPVSQVDDFVVIAGDPSDTASKERYEVWAQHAKAVLDKAGNFKPSGKLSGSFICAHPPDYRGRPAMKFGVEDWRALFREFKELDMDTVIWQAASWMELQECYYRSRLLSDYKQWNVMDAMVKAANEEKMFLYLGTFGVLNGELSLGVKAGDIGMAAAAADRELACYRELLDLYRGAFQGYYLSSETYYGPWRAPLAYKHYGVFFERITNNVKETTPELKILASPASLQSAGHEQEAAGRLLECFGRARVDMFAPMDCIGQLEELGNLEADLRVWKEVSRATGAEFWVNCESFAIPGRRGAVMQIEPAEPRRFLYQLTIADSMGAKKLVTWEAMHFMDPNGNAKARALRRAYSDSLRR